jgi:hypothetical protein
MASRSYNPTPFPISNSIEDTLEYYNMRKNPNSQPLIFKRPPIVVIRDTPVQNVERLYGGNMKKSLEMDAKEPMRRPAGFVEPHSSGAKKYISNGNSASYPVFNAVEQKAIDAKVGGLVRLETKPKPTPRPRPLPTIDMMPNPEVLKAVGGAVKRGRGRPRKIPMEGEGLWEDMNAWGKRNEMAVKKVIANPAVQSIINNPAVQKLGKKALKTAVGMIPVVGSTAVQALDAVGFGNIPRKEIVKKIMAEKGLSLIEASKYVKANGLYVAKPKTPRAKK